MDIAFEVETRAAENPPMWTMRPAVNARNFDLERHEHVPPVGEGFMHGTW